MTQPWAEPPEDAKRATEAARAGRKLAPPKVTMKLDEPDDDVLEALLVDDAEDRDAPVPKGVRPAAKARGAAPANPGANHRGKPRADDDSWNVPPAPDAQRKPKPSLDVWRDAIEEATSDQDKRRR